MYISIEQVGLVEEDCNAQIAIFEQDRHWQEMSYKLINLLTQKRHIQQ